MASHLSRRAFLITATSSALAVAAGCRPSGLIVPTPYQPGSTDLPPTNTPMPPPTSVLAATSAPPDPNYGAVTFDKIIITPSNRLYDTQYNYSKTPTLDAATWTLKIDGLVELPLTLTYADVMALPAYEEMRTIECIGNPVGGGLIGNVVWKGFHLEDILAKVKIKPTATHAKFEAGDGYSTAVKVEYITQPNVMMAHSFNGEVLDKTHGFPLRILMPGLYGQKMPRWIQHIEFIDQDYIGYWEGNGYSNIATINTNSIIKSPSDGAAVIAGDQVAIQGVALAAPRKITKVEVRIDQGDWQPAQVTAGPNTLAWTQWYLIWTPPAPGSYQIAVRATDETGFVQTHDANGPFGKGTLNGTDAIHVISVNAT
jgi:DMSO/TMAO reductase YedYZ molybdopterin-dependent catalytic subunit